MKLHLPLFLRKSVLSCLALVAGCTLSSGTLAFADDLVLGTGDKLAIDYAAADSIPNLKNGTLQLTGDTLLQLLNCGSGDGKIYTLATGVSSLLDAEGNAITLDSTNNAISNYFDATQPGTGFWAGGTLVYAADGTLTLVRHNENVISSSDPNGVTRVTTQQSGGANYQYYKGITFSGIEGAPVTPLSLDGLNRTITPTYSCGAIYGGNDSTITLSNNGSVKFERNKALSTFTSSSYRGEASVVAYGGAVCSGSIELDDNGSVKFEGNTASSTGSAVYSSTGYSDVYSYSSSYGGAIYGGDRITISTNGSVVIVENTVSATSIASASSSSSNHSSRADANSNAYGGAIYGESGTIELSNNNSVMFMGNTVTALANAAASSSNDSSRDSAKASVNAYGGVIYGGDSSTITLSHNSGVMFAGNTVSADSFSSFLYTGNSVCDTGSNFISNANAYGGAIYGASSSTIELCGNGNVKFEGNKALSSASCNGYSYIYAHAYGGAIYTEGDLRIQNNASVLFEKNTTVSDGSYCLRSIYAAGSGCEILLSSAADKSIEFLDSVYIGSGYTVNLNADYGDIKQQGDIIFTGRYTEQHLNELLEAAGAGRTSRASEILNSRTTEVNAMTNLYGGRLRVEDGAIYQGYGITAHEGSAATVRVKDAALSHAGYDLTFNAGTTLELAGSSSISGNVQMLEGSTLRFDCIGVDGVNCLDGNLSFTGAGNIILG